MHSHASAPWPVECRLGWCQPGKAPSTTAADAAPPMWVQNQDVRRVAAGPWHWLKGCAPSTASIVAGVITVPWARS
jgi:hypothetical protein